MEAILQGKKILILSSGGIAIYKILDVISRLNKMGADVAVVLSPAAQRLITPLAFEAMSHRAVLCESTQSWESGAPNHISYASWADIALFAPASVNSIAKFRYGIADNVLLTTLLACKCPILIAPSANVNMIESPQNRENLSALASMGHTIIPPRTSLLACGVSANGAMASVDEIIFALQKCVLSDDFWRGKHIVISGGGSIEAIDSVRYISNHSSGLQASYLAVALYLLGARVDLVASRFPINLPLSITRTEVKSSAEFKTALNALCAKDSALIMAAAISDFIPASPVKGKVKKAEVGTSWNLALAQNDDIINGIECAYKVAFKAECDKQKAESYARQMLLSAEYGGKGCDMVLLNDVNSGVFGSEENEIIAFVGDSQTTLAKKDKFSISLEIAALIKENWR